MDLGSNYKDEVDETTVYYDPTGVYNGREYSKNLNTSYDQTRASTIKNSTSKKALLNSGNKVIDSTYKRRFKRLSLRNKAQKLEKCHSVDNGVLETLNGLVETEHQRRRIKQKEKERKKQLRLNVKKLKMRSKRHRSLLKDMNISARQSQVTARSNGNSISKNPTQESTRRSFKYNNRW